MTGDAHGMDNFTSNLYKMKGSNVLMYTHFG
jgi:hypothetical protein